MSEWGEVLAAVPVGETVRVKWHYQNGVGAPPEPSEFTGEVIEHGPLSTHIRNSFGSNLYLPRLGAILDCQWL